MKRLIALLLVLVIAGCSASRFEQVGFYRKSLTNGSTARVYSVFVNDFKDDSTVWNEIELYGRNKSYTPGGSTFVFFFSSRSYTPDVVFVGAEFDDKYDKYCVATYFNTGVQGLTKFPFSK